MYGFLSRLGHLFVAIPILVAAIVIFGGSSLLTAVPAAHHQNVGTMSCAVSSAGVGQQLVVSGHGFGAATQYVLNVTTPRGGWTTVATTDATGSFTYDSTAFASGAYSASVWSEGGRTRQVAACTSLTL